MEPYPNLEQTPVAAGAAPAVAPLVATNSEAQTQSSGSANRSVQADVSAALAAARAGGSRAFDTPLRFPAEDRGHSLAQMAQRDLDAALQLLAERAQYITGANGAAIALRRNGKKDMLCRASAGGNAPELGALFSTEFGLSGESVRARRPLRCDDAQHDQRVNHEVCRELGIASVVVMPVVQDDEVLGVFELFSGTANAFGERDLSALRRLSEMVETAVKLARVSDGLQERIKTAQPAMQDSVEEISALPDPVLTDEGEADVQSLAVEVEPLEKAAETIQPNPGIAGDALPKPARPEPAKKPLFWSAAAGAGNEIQKAAQAETSHIPPVLRNLSACGACGFPVSPGRELCVECEEKEWRGQLKAAAGGASGLGASGRREGPASH